MAWINEAIYKEIRSFCTKIEVRGSDKMRSANKTRNVSPDSLRISWFCTISKADERKAVTALMFATLKQWAAVKLK